MPRPRGSEHTTLTETAEEVVKVLKTFPAIKMIAPGIIDPKRSGKRFVTIVHTTGGFTLIISGTGVQKIAVHLTDISKRHEVVKALVTHKRLTAFRFNERDKQLT